MARFWIPPPRSQTPEHVNSAELRQGIYSILDRTSFPEASRTILVTGLFSDAYSLFSVTTVTPILGIVYYGGAMPCHYELALIGVTLAGAILGHIGFGFLADVYGRRKVYGTEITLIIMTTFGVVMSSSGIDGSMSLMGWLLAWRLMLGIGIGGGSSIGAVICAEFAPNHLRGKMMAAQFMLQPLGQLAAMLVTLAVVASHRNGVLSEVTSTTCTDECLRTLDSTWRWVVGIGIIPAAITSLFRLTIPESPRFTLDVIQGSTDALKDVQKYYGRGVEEMPPIEEVSSSLDTEMETQQPRPLRQRAQCSIVSATHTVGSTVSRSSSEASGATSKLERQRDVDQEVDEEDGYTQTNPDPYSSQEIMRYFWREGNLRTLIATALCSACVDLPFYALLLNTPRVVALIWEDEDFPVVSVYTQLVQLCWQSVVAIPTGGLIGCAITFVAIDKIGRRNVQMAGFLALSIIFVLVGTSFNHLSKIGLGGTSAMALIYVLSQVFFSFGPSTTTYILPAELFPTRYRCLSHGISAAFGKLGAVIGLFFLGYVDYGHGIDHRVIHLWLPYSMLVLSFFMLCGLLITIKWIPGVEHSSRGKPKTLEEWAAGRIITERK